MSGVALAFVLGSAVLHATWNTLVADARDTHVTAALAIVAGVLALALPAALTWDVDAAAIPFVIASAALELAYFGLLATAYAGADLTTIYPVARGAAPVIALVVSVAFLAAPVSAVQALGVVAVAAGVLLVRGFGRPTGPALPLALGVACCIAGYTLVDDRGLEHAAPVPYFALVLALTAVPYVGVLALRRGRGALRAAVGPLPVAIGVGLAASYLLTLAALERAEAAPVAALRETSVVMATLAAAVLGRSRVPPGRLVGAAVVVGGVAAIAMG